MDSAPNSKDYLSSSHPSQKGRLPLKFRRRSQPHRALTYGDTYLCPVCRHGHISQMALMDAFACDFCRHIFEINVSQQTIQVVDSTQPLLWHWNGRKWTSRHDLDESLTLFLWMVGGFLTLVPASIISITAYIFPPLPQSQWVWLPFVWAAATFLTHLFMVGWLLAEHYQLPFYVLSKLRIRRWFNR